MIKKVATAFLACALCAGLAAPVMALDTTVKVESGEITISEYTRSETVTLQFLEYDEIISKEVTVYYVPTTATVTMKGTTPESLEYYAGCTYYSQNAQGVYVGMGGGMLGSTPEDASITKFPLSEASEHEGLISFCVLSTDDTNVYVMLEGNTQPAQSEVPPVPVDANTAYATSYKILVDGREVGFDAYALKDANGNDTNYLKLRDVASILNGSKAQFNVTWDGAINMETGAAYVANGSEMSTPFTGNQSYTVNASPVKVNGSETSLDAITLTDASGNGYTYFKLRDLGQALGFLVDWDGANITISTGN